MNSVLLQVVIVVAFGAFCFGCGYLTAFIVTRNQWRHECSTSSQVPAVVPAIRDWNPRALDALFGVVQDATANPKSESQVACASPSSA